MKYYKYLSSDYMAHYRLSLQGDNHPRRAKHHTVDPAEIDFCLNCTKAKCNGNCTQFKRFKANRRKGADDGEQNNQ